jgi:glycosyltransferase involved in cell wall biosynthesis
MKILLLVSELPPTRSGVALSADRLIELYRRKGHEADAIVMRRLPRLVWREIRLSFFFLRWPSILKVLRNYDCLHIHGPAPTFSDLALLLLRVTTARSARPKVVYTHHFELDIPGFRLPCRLYNRLHGRLLSLADSVVVTSRAYQRLLLARGLADVQVIPWGADHRSYPARRRIESRFDILTVAQLRPYKGIEVLLRAFQRVPDADLHVVGDGHRRKRYEALAARLGSSRVHFHGQLSDVDLDALFSTSHVIVLSSVSMMEAFGISLLEGMMAGCVPVASNLPGVADVVEDAGILVPQGDPDALAEALLRLRRDRALLDRLSLRAIQRAGSHRWRESAERYVELFERLTKDEGSERRSAPASGSPRDAGNESGEGLVESLPRRHRTPVSLLKW